MGRTPDRERRKRIEIVDFVVTDTNDISSVLLDLSGTGAERETYTGTKGFLHLEKVDTPLGKVALVLARVPKGHTPTSLSVTHGAEIYDQPENVLWSLLVSSGVVNTAIFPGFDQLIEIDVKSKRKLKVGDRIILILRAEVTADWRVSGSLSTFSLE